MSDKSDLKNIFNDIPNLSELKQDLYRLKNYNDLKKSKNANPDKLNSTKPTLFNLKGELKIPFKKYNSSPIKIKFNADEKLENISITVIARLNDVSPEYRGTQTVTFNSFVDDRFDNYDFYNVIEKCIAGFKLTNPDDFESIEDILEKAGVSDLNEFLEQIYVTDEFKDFLKVYDDNLTIRDLSKIIDSMVSSRDYGLKYFESMMTSKTSPDGFNYSDIAQDIIDLLMKQ